MSDRNHVFLFRHCLRSTRAHLNIHEGKMPIYNATEFTQYPTPDWNVPAYWCLPEGLDMVQNAGNYLMSHILSQIGDDNKDEGDDDDDDFSQYPRNHEFHFQFISDTSQRDIDTSYYLSLGIQEALSKTNYKSYGLSSMHYDPLIFNPFNNHYMNEDQSYCNAGSLFFSGTNSSSQLALVSQILQRLELVQKPGGSTVENILQKLQKHTGIGPAGKFVNITTGTSSKTQAMKNKTNDLKLVYDEEVAREGWLVIPYALQGSINVLKLYAEMMFFARAGLGFDFLPNTTLPEVYSFVSWIYYIRSILMMENSYVATKGSIISRRLLQSLEFESYSRESTSNYVTNVTIYLGHDHDLLSVATALGLRWKLGPPYFQFQRQETNNNIEILSTPPLSGLYFQHDLTSGYVGLSFMYPVMLQEAPDEKGKYGYVRNMSGILDLVPVELSSTTTFEYKNDTNTLWISPHQNNDDEVVKNEKSEEIESTTYTAVDLLNKRLVETFERFPEAEICFSKIYHLDVIHENHSSQNHTNVTFAHQTGIPTESSSSKHDIFIPLGPGPELPSSSSSSSSHSSLERFLFFNFLLIVVFLGALFFHRRQRRATYYTLFSHSIPEEEHIIVNATSVNSSKRKSKTQHKMAKDNESNPLIREEGNYHQFQSQQQSSKDTLPGVELM